MRSFSPLCINISVQEEFTNPLSSLIEQDTDNSSAILTFKSDDRFFPLLFYEIGKP
jgi:hypothetical protein